MASKDMREIEVITSRCVSEEAGVFTHIALQPVDGEVMSFSELYLAKVMAADMNLCQVFPTKKYFVDNGNVYHLFSRMICDLSVLERLIYSATEFKVIEI